MVAKIINDMGYLVLSNRGKLVSKSFSVGRKSRSKRLTWVCVIHRLKPSQLTVDKVKILFDKTGLCE